MTKSEINEKIACDEFDGEKLICKFRIVISLIFAAGVPVVSLMRGLNGENHFPPQAYICCFSFIIYSISIYFYLKSRTSVSPLFKYICVVIDMIIQSASIWIGCTYPDAAPAVIYLSTWALFFIVLIMLGAFRYSVKCAYFSGVFAGFCYLLVVIINRKNIDLPYYVILDSQTIKVSFPVFNEAFRVIAMFLTGLITGIACKRHLDLFNNMLETQSNAALSATMTIEQTRGIAATIQKSTDEIFISSKLIFSTANNQAASIQEIESTVDENTRIAKDIVNKISGVAGISSKMEANVNHGFSILELNIEQLKEIKEKNDMVISGIVSLENKISKIRDIVKNITTITDQTKVIAFNAALEAASAGENGKRFAVVASEVNRLSDDIASLTRQIREQVEEIQNSSSSLIVSSKESAEKITEGNNLIIELESIFQEIRSYAEITSNQAQLITTSTQRQLNSTEQINLAITDISKGLFNFIQSTKIATSSADDLNQMTVHLGSILKKEDNEKEGAE
ncbi:MAG: methyl-accepting chemotaxis protein [Treponema sp.]|nr:methyl-accepting chemotaxis protein [Treponema sp.]